MMMVVLLAPLLASGGLAAGSAHAQVGDELQLRTVWGPVVIRDANGDGVDDTEDYDTFVQNFEVTGTGIEPTHAAQLLCSYLGDWTDAGHLGWPARPRDAICHLVIETVVTDTADVSRLAAVAEVDLAAFSCRLRHLGMTVFDATGGFSDLLGDGVALAWSEESAAAQLGCDLLAGGGAVLPSLLAPPTDFELVLTSRPL